MVSYMQRLRLSSSAIRLRLTDPGILIEVHVLEGRAEIFTAGNDTAAVERISAAVVKQIDSGEETTCGTGGRRIEATKLYK